MTLGVVACNGGGQSSPESSATPKSSSSAPAPSSSSAAPSSSSSAGEVVDYLQILPRTWTEGTPAKKIAAIRDTFL